MAKAGKSDEVDRERVVQVLQSSLGIRLARAGARRKWFRDEHGRSYWVLVGTGDWHGIPEEMMQGRRLHVKEVPGLALREISDQTFTDEEKAHDVRIRPLKQALSKLSPEERAQLRRDLEGSR
jgi:hypothetical protein